jgi:hypothetical protein
MFQACSKRRFCKCMIIKECSNVPMFQALFWFWLSIANRFMLERLSPASAYHFFATPPKLAKSLGTQNKPSFLLHYIIIYIYIYI